MKSNQQIKIRLFVLMDSEAENEVANKLQKTEILKDIVENENGISKSAVVEVNQKEKRPKTSKKNKFYVEDENTMETLVNRKPNLKLKQENKTNSDNNIDQKDLSEKLDPRKLSKSSKPESIKTEWQRSTKIDKKLTDLFLMSSLYYPHNDKDESSYQVNNKPIKTKKVSKKSKKKSKAKKKIEKTQKKTSISESSHSSKEDEVGEEEEKKPFKTVSTFSDSETEIESKSDSKSESKTESKNSDSTYKSKIKSEKDKNEIKNDDDKESKKKESKLNRAKSATTVASKETTLTSELKEKSSHRVRKSSRSKSITFKDDDKTNEESKEDKKIIKKTTERITSKLLPTRETNYSEPFGPYFENRFQQNETYEFRNENDRFLRALRKDMYVMKCFR